MDHEHLAVTMRARADANGRNGQPLGDLLGQVLWNAFQHHRERATILYRQSIAHDCFPLVLVLTLNLIAAEPMNRLRGEANVSHDRDANLDDGLDRTWHRSTALEFHPLGTALLEEPPGIPDRLLPTYLIGEKRHVPDHQSTLATARNRSRVVDHLLHRNRQGIRLALKDAANRVADQEDINAGLVQNPRKGIIVSGETGDLFPQTLFFDDMRYGDLLSHCFTLQK